MELTGKYRKNERIGRMNYRPEIHFYTETVNDTGERLQTWQLLATVFAQVTYQDLRSRESEQGGQKTVQQSIVVTLRYRADIDETQRLYIAPRLYYIEAISITEDKQYMNLTCRQYDFGSYVTPSGDIFLDVLYLQEFTGITGDTVTVTVYGGLIPTDRARVWVTWNGQETQEYTIAGDQIIFDFTLIESDIVTVRFAR